MSEQKTETNSLTEWAEEEALQLRFTKIPCATQPVEYLVVELIDSSGTGDGVVKHTATFVHFRAKRIAEFIGSLERR